MGTARMFSSEISSRLKAKQRQWGGKEQEWWFGRDGMREKHTHNKRRNLNEREIERKRKRDLIKQYSAMRLFQC